MNTSQIKTVEFANRESLYSLLHVQDYYIADKSLVIYFQVYDLAPYVYGFIYFPISVYAIQDIIQEDGPLGEMMY